MVNIYYLGGFEEYVNFYRASNPHLGALLPHSQVRIVYAVKYLCIVLKVKDVEDILSNYGNV